MKSVYKFLFKIKCGDCIDLISQLPDNCVDLIITSPPYDFLRDYHGYKFNFKRIAKELFRIIKNGKVLVWIVGDATINGSETGTSFRQALYFKKIGFNLHDTMVYEKSGFANPSSNRYHQTFEYMFILTKGKLKVFNPIKDRKNKWERAWGINMVRQKDGSLKRRASKKRICKIWNEI